MTGSLTWRVPKIVVPQIIQVMDDQFSIETTMVTWGTSIFGFPPFGFSQPRSLSCTLRPKSANRIM